MRKLILGARGMVFSRVIKLLNEFRQGLVALNALLIVLLCVGGANARAEVTPPVVQTQNNHVEEVNTHKVDATTMQWVVSPRDVTLRRALARWASQAGWQLHWDAAVDLPISVTATFEGDFRSAIHTLFISLSAAEINLSALLYTGNHVLRVTESGQRAQ